MVHNANSETSTCGDLEIFGGYNVFGKDTIISKEVNLGDHD